MKLILSGWLLFTSASWAMEGSVEITGRGSVSRAPEFSEIQVVVVSICYSKPTEAQKNNSELSRNILEVLKPYVRSEQDKLTASGGHTLRQNEYTAHDDGTSKLLCEGGWRTSNTLTLQTNDLESVSLIQEKVVGLIGAEESSLGSQAQTFAELQQPFFSVYPLTYEQMKKEAQRNAWSDAKSQFQVFLEECKLENVKLSQISQPEYFALAKASPGSREGSVPIIPDAISVNANWRFTWTFDPTACFR